MIIEFVSTLAVLSAAVGAEYLFPRRKEKII